MVNRYEGKKGYCGMDSTIRVARAALHMWEEPVISGTKGSGTVFFSGCPLRCVYCQNHNIAVGDFGKNISPDRLVEIFFELKEQGANNINLVTPTHYIPQVAQALQKAKNQGLDLPVVYNTGSYENVDALKLLDGLIDVYLPDCKYYSKELSKKYSNAKDYFEVAVAAIDEMVRQVGEPVFVKEQDREVIVSDWENEEKSILKKGVIIRHLVLPGCVDDSKMILEYLHTRYGNSVFLSIMNQYTPVVNLDKYPELNRKITKKEYESVIDYAISIGVENGFIQEGDTAQESFIPDFDCAGVLE